MGGIRNVLIVGAGGLGHRLAVYLEEHPELGRSVCGFVDDWKPLGNGVIGRISELAELARTGFVDEVILAGPHDREKTLRVVRAARELRLDVKMAPDLFGCEPTRKTERIGDIPLISLHEERLPVAGLLLKRAAGCGQFGSGAVPPGARVGLARNSREVGFAGACALWGAKGRTQGETVSLLQVSHHGSGRGCFEREAAGAKSEAGSIFQNHGRSTNHAGRTTPAPLQSGRTSAVMERDERRDEPGRTAAASAG